ncbi:hypothetical protein Bca52824_042273 [Brassica carinata]|uniref:Tf2-1-like SH3-like domain-containing protein n=1 Tax=Brassica carinata TaxID=52824 RepID=A0A8X7UYM1_BRACI|nr:hypothetical protein Bca52824_042273 [Brassica carinata]
MIPRCPLDLSVAPDRTRLHGEAVDFVIELEAVHQRARDKLEHSVAKYKAAADSKCRELRSRKIGPVEVVECINPNAYRVRLPPHIRTADVFNVKHLSRFHGDNDPLASETKLSSSGGT